MIFKILDDIDDLMEDLANPTNSPKPENGEHDDNAGDDDFFNEIFRTRNDVSNCISIVFNVNCR